MGEMTSKTKAALAAIIAIARLAAETGKIDVFRGYVEQTGAVGIRGGGWLYLTGTGWTVHGMRQLAARVAGGDFVSLAGKMAEQYAKTMPDSEPAAEPKPQPVTPGPERTTHVGTLGLRSCADEGCPGCTPEQHAAEAANAQRFEVDDHVLTPAGLTGLVTDVSDNGRIVEVTVGDSRTAYAPEHLRLCRLTALDGRRFEVGDVVRWKGDAAGEHWRIEALQETSDGPSAGLIAVNDPGPGQLRTGGYLRLLEHVPVMPTGGQPASVSIAALRADRERNIAAIKTLAEQLDVPLDELVGMTPGDDGDPAESDSVADLVDRIVRRAQYLALREMLPMIDGWIEGARENRRREPFDETFHPDDIRSMVNDVARVLGVPEPYRKASS